jgi:hypothetical protein
MRKSSAALKPFFQLLDNFRIFAKGISAGFVEPVDSPLHPFEPSVVILPQNGGGLFGTSHPSAFSG